MAGFATTAKGTSSRDAAVPALPNSPRIAASDVASHALAGDNLFDLDAVLDDIVGNIGGARHAASPHDRIFAGSL